MRVPTDKFDIEALENVSTIEIVKYQDELLEWVQDINWPVAGKICDLLTPIVNEIESGIIKVLNKNDYEWKYNVISKMLYNAPSLSELILSEIKKLYKSPTELDDLKEECKYVLDKFR